jgi:fructoselysine 6-kinase
MGEDVAMQAFQPLRAAIVGDNTIDRYLGPPVTEYVGGNAVNVAVQLSRVGHDAGAGAVGYFGAIGPDADGATIARALERTGLDLGGLVRQEGVSAVTEISLTANGDRVFEREDFGVTASYYPDTAALDRIAAASWVHIGMMSRSAELVAELVSRNPALMISQDCSVSSGHASLAVAFDSAGEDESRSARMADAAIAGGSALAVVTLGALGAVAFDGTSRWRQNAHAARVVDTTGAGDAFTAGFIDARLNGTSIQDALAAGARLAAATCEHLAGFPQ